METFTSNLPLCGDTFATIAHLWNAVNACKPIGARWEFRIDESKAHRPASTDKDKDRKPLIYFSCLYAANGAEHSSCPCKLQAIQLAKTKDTWTVLDVVEQHQHLGSKKKNKAKKEAKAAATETKVPAKEERPKKKRKAVAPPQQPQSSFLTTNATMSAKAGVALDHEELTQALLSKQKAPVAPLIVQKQAPKPAKASQPKSKPKPKTAVKPTSVVPQAGPSLALFHQSSPQKESLPQLSFSFSPLAPAAITILPPSGPSSAPIELDSSDDDPAPAKPIPSTSAASRPIPSAAAARPGQAGVPNFKPRMPSKRRRVSLEEERPPSISNANSVPLGQSRPTAQAHDSWDRPSEPRDQPRPEHLRIRRPDETGPPPYAGPSRQRSETSLGQVGDIKAYDADEYRIISIDDGCVWMAHV